MSTIRTGEPRELLALIPFQLGFQPRNSAVVVSLRGPRSRVGLVARVDLDDLVDPVRGPSVGRSLVAHLVDDGARHAVLVVYSDEPSRATRASLIGPARTHLADACQPVLGALPCWVVGPDGWYGADCADRACCPDAGRPLSDLQATEVGASMVLAGARVARTREEVAAIPTAPADARRSARRAGERWSDRAPTTMSPSGAHRWRRDGLALWRRELERALHTVIDGGGGDDVGSPAGLSSVVGSGSSPRSHGWEPPGAAVLGRLRAALADVLVRDAVLLWFVDGADRVADRVVAGDGGGPEVGDALGRIVDPRRGMPPDARRHAAGRALLEQVVGHSSRDVQAPALTLLAVLAWWQGDGARAGLLIDRALSADPSHRLAALIDQTLAAGMPPGWLRDRETWG